MQNLSKSAGARATLAAAGFVCFAAAARADDWKPSEKAAARLQAAQTFDGFSVRLPAGAGALKIEGSGDGKSKTYTWSLSPRGDNAAAFIITTHPAVPGQTPDQILTQWTTQFILGRLNEIGRSPMQLGTVATDAFARMYYHGRETTGVKALLHGFVYAGVESDRAYIIEARDPTDKFTTSLPQAEAAALTLKSATPAPGALDAAKRPDATKELAADAHLADLADEVLVEGFAMRPPKGYTKTNPPIVDPAVTLTAWEGEPNDSGMRPMFLFRTTPVKGAHAASPIEDGLDAAVETLRRFLPSVQMDPTKYGTLHGMDCGYASYAGTQNGQDYHGVIYSIHDEDLVLIAGGGDTAPGSDTSLPIIEAACRSIHKP